MEKANLFEEEQKEFSLVIQFFPF
jgi:hypothetical protein